MEAKTTEELGTEITMANISLIKDDFMRLVIQYQITKDESILEQLKQIAKAEQEELIKIKNCLTLSSNVEELVDTNINLDTKFKSGIPFYKQ